MPKKDKKLKKKGKHKEKKKKSKRKYRSSSSDSKSDSSAESSEYEWVEKKSELRTQEKSPQHEDWLSGTLLCHTYSLKDERKEQKQNANKNECIIAEPGQSSRELNPYWRNGGTGLPEESKESNSEIDSHQDVVWLKKALKRAKEHAKSENIPLETVVAERYGPLENLYKLIDKAEAKTRAKKSSNHDGYRKTEAPPRLAFMKPTEDDESNAQFSFESYRRSQEVEDVHEKRREFRHQNASNSKPAKKSSNYDGHRKTEAPSRLAFMKPFEDDESNAQFSCKSYRRSQEVEDVHEKKREFRHQNASNSKPAEVMLSDQEMNSLASKILKAEIMGNTALVKELNDKLSRAKKVREEAENNSAKDKHVILTTTNTRGFTQPIRKPTERHEKKKRKTYDTHVAGERVRYFEDDDKYSLNQMYEKEMTQSVSDQNAEFLRLASKSKGDKDYAIDDLFMEQTTSNRSEKEKRLSGAIDKQKKAEKALDHCTWCLVNNKLQKHLIVSTATKSYLSIPFFQSLTDGHCLIAPIYHSTCSTLVDEDVWEEMVKYCRHLVQLFRAQDQDVVFFETAFNFKNYPHMLLHCVPVPIENGDLLPIYFKKAIMECEKKWAQNKQVVNVSKFDVKRVIPKGLPYFMVHFGMDNGFAHVIEDEKRFPRNFAQEIIGGMLDLDHHIWRKQQADGFETQCKKVNNFKSFWKELE